MLILSNQQPTLSDDDSFPNDSDTDDVDTKKLFEKYKEKTKAAQQRQTKHRGKSNLTLDIKPTDTDVNLGALETRVRGLPLRGVKWLGSQLIDVAYGIQLIRILCQIEDDLIDPDTIREAIEQDDAVQSTDVMSFTMAWHGSWHDMDQGMTFTMALTQTIKKSLLSESDQQQTFPIEKKMSSFFPCSLFESLQGTTSCKPPCGPAAASTSSMTLPEKKQQSARFPFACPNTYTPCISAMLQDSLIASEYKISDDVCWMQTECNGVTTLSGTFRWTHDFSRENGASTTKWLFSVPCDKPVGENSIISGNFFYSIQSGFDPVLSPIYSQENGKLVAYTTDFQISQKQQHAAQNKRESAECSGKSCFEQLQPGDRLVSGTGQILVSYTEPIQEVVC